MGRPKGSGNIVKALPIAEASPDAAPLTKRPRGRPKGEKNKRNLTLVRDGEMEVLDGGEPKKRRGGRPKGGRNRPKSDAPIAEILAQLDDGDVTYEKIKLVAKLAGVRTPDLFPLMPQNDPFYSGSPGDEASAAWFGKLWHKFGYATGVHLRRIHYQIISQNIPVLMPSGKPYENTENCWHWLDQASLAWRYQDARRFDDIVDHRNPPPEFHPIDKPDGPVGVYVASTDERLRFGAYGVSVFTFPKWITWPEVRISNFEGEQRYDLWVCAEKSTQNDILQPLCEEHHVSLMTGVGQLSAKQMYDLAQYMQREAAGKPVRILYLSDYDPSGKSMPVAAARKIEWQIRNAWHSAYGRPDVRLYHLLLTAKQCERYELPRTPLKKTVQDRNKDEEFAEGGVELDALEALYPGLLARIVEDAIEHYRDADLDDRVDEAEEKLRAAINDVYLGRVCTFTTRSRWRRW